MDFGVRALWKKTRTVFANELRANTSPPRASLSLAVGVLVGLSPFYGFHTVFVLALAFMFRLNRPLALAASGITLLPFVPFWIAAGIIMGKIIVPVETAGRIIDFVYNMMTFEHFYTLVSGTAKFCRRFFPSAVFDTVDEEAGHGVIDGFVQWFIGCSVFAVLGAVVTFAACYGVLVRREAARSRKTAAKDG